MKKIWCIGLLLAAVQVRADDVKEETIVSEKHVMTVEADNLVGDVYNLWNVRVINSISLWKDPVFLEKIPKISKHIKYINSIRCLGGKTGGSDEWFQEVDNQGEIICDFSGFIDYVKAQKAAGYIPWIVLDNVPQKMSSQPFNKYGNTSPPDDFDLWFRYVQKFLTALVDEFGLEEVSSWRYRVGTEPDLFPGHWSGTKEEYFKHYDYTVAALESIIKDPWIGPGNMLMWNGSQKGQKGGRWGFDILKHCAEGTNYYTGKIGTKIDYYSQSVYAMSPHPFLYEENMQKVRAELAKYPSIKDIDCEIHEYGELNECLSRGEAVSNTEFFAGLYAHTVDVAYRYNVRRIYNWDQHMGTIYGVEQIVPGLFDPWMNVMDCLAVMEGGQRVNVLKDAQKQLKFGTIAAWKNDDLYLLVYSHHDNAKQASENNIALTLVGDRIARENRWSIDEQLLDQHNGVFIHQLYKDIEAAGIPAKETKFYLQRNIGARYGEENMEGVIEVITKNLKKYQEMGEMKSVKAAEKIDTVNGIIELNLDFHGSALRFIRLSPAE
ncbi:GH39 family glycosyl hydrolase [Novipirellula artificiosorum]|uniref:Beta-xylosidase n=1 Tax=Novipirellula artificiosorum TaxID=2528016 RepID=A0A5C6DBN4_9BACT|nr:hypothetical protein [Novipirellula artificiosorum]TWU33187.1 Beta-xylosidase [Novipirellula artificiosorum]